LKLRRILNFIVQISVDSTWDNHRRPVVTGPLCKSVLTEVAEMCLFTVANQYRAVNSLSVRQIRYIDLDLVWELVSLQRRCSSGDNSHKRKGCISVEPLLCKKIIWSYGVGYPMYSNSL